MKRAYIAAIACAFLVSAFFFEIVRWYGHAHVEARPHIEWLHAVAVLCSFPGTIVSTLIFGMCNASTTTGAIVSFLANALFYAMPLVIAVRIRQLKRLRALAADDR